MWKQTLQLLFELIAHTNYSDMWVELVALFTVIENNQVILEEAVSVLMIAWIVEHVISSDNKKMVAFLIGPLLLA